MVTDTVHATCVAFRVDASTEIGTGHVMRCLTLAARLREQGAQIHFVCRAHAGHLAEFIELQGHTVHLLSHKPDPCVALDEPYASWLGAPVAEDAQSTVQLLEALHPDWLVVDHYGIDARWHAVLRGHVEKIFVIDDLANRPHDCDVLLDQNVLRNAGSRYAGLVPAHCTLLLGPRYALLRPEFVQARRNGLHARSEVRRLLIFFGGSDQHDLTNWVLDILEKLANPALQVDVVVGAANLRAAHIEQRCKKSAGARFFRQIDNMAALMSEADLALGSAGGASWERCCLGLPTILINTAENQVELASELARKRVLVNLGLSTALSPKAVETLLQKLLDRPALIRRLSARAARLVDGRGADRVALCLGGVSLELRPAVPADAERVWSWRNAPTTRQQSFDASVVSLPDHRAWWLRSIEAEDRILLIGTIGALDVGVLRFDIAGTSALISIYLDPDLTGQGLGSALLKKGLDWVQSNRPDILSLDAQVKTTNHVSRRMFVASGFKEEYLSYSWSREK